MAGSRTTPVHTTAPTPERRRFRELYREQYAFVWHTLRRFGIAAPHLDDVVQETFMVAYRRRRDLTEGSARSWLYGISRRVASNHRRSAWRRQRKQRAIHADQSPWTAVPEATIALRALDDFLETLDMTDRELFVLSELEGLTGPELSDALGRNMATLYSRIRTLRRRFLAFSDAEAVPPAMARVQQERPRATLAGWIALWPQLEGIAPEGIATGWTWPAWATSTGGGVGIGTMLGAVVVVGLALGSRVEATPDPPETARAVAHAPVEAPHRSGPTEPGPDPEAPVTADETTVTVEVGPPRLEPRRAPAPIEPVEPVEPVEPAEPAKASGLAEQNALLFTAKQALEAGTPGVALDQLDEHQRRFPRSAQADLVAALRIDALCALGREPQARGEAALLVRSRPASPVAERVRRSCAHAVMESSASGHGPR